MDSLGIPRHVFISFPSSQRPFVDKLCKDLSSQGLSVWTDYQYLTPGTPDWESAIRAAIRESYAVLLVASREVPDSPYVKAELSLARARQRPIYPLWAEGEHWVDCVPLEHAHTQYVDLRGGKYSDGVRWLVSRLQSTQDAVLPRHVPVKAYMASNAESHWAEPAPFPPGFFGISLGEDRENREDESGVLVRSTGYTSLGGLLNELYVEYLRNRFKPLTYGKEWVLVEDGIINCRVIAPWSWAESLTKGTGEIPLDWLTQASLQSCGFVAGTRWRIERVKGKDVTAIAWHDRRLAQTVTRELKLIYILRSRGLLEDIPSDQVIPHEYAELQVLCDLEPYDPYAEQVNVRFFRQTMDRSYVKEDWYKFMVRRYETMPDD
jgi:hypothetical protein